jgi:hypothetical protein
MGPNTNKNSSSITKKNDKSGFFFLGLHFIGGVVIYRYITQRSFFAFLLSVAYQIAEIVFKLQNKEFAEISEDLFISSLNSWFFFLGFNLAGFLPF